MLKDISKQAIKRYIQTLQDQGLFISDDSKKRLEEINHDSNWLIFNSLSLRAIEDERPVRNSYSGQIMITVDGGNWVSVRDTEPLIDADGNYSSRTVGARQVYRLDDDFFIELNKFLKEAGENEISRGPDGRFMYKIVGLSRRGRQIAPMRWEEVWTDEPYYLEDENGEFIGRHVEPDGREWGIWPYFRLLNTQTNHLITWPQRMEKVLTDSFEIAHDEFKELIKECLDNPDDFNDEDEDGFRLQFRGEESVQEWPRPKEREWIAIRKDRLENGYAAGYLSSLYSDNAESNWKKRASLEDLLNVSEIKEILPISPTDDNETDDDYFEGVNEAAEVIYKIPGIVEKNDEIVRRGRELGLNLVDISQQDTNQLNELVDWDTGWNHSNNDEARGVVMSIEDTYRENKRRLAEAERRREPEPEPDPDQDPSLREREVLEQVKKQTIAQITQLMTKEPAITDSDLLENNRDWKNLINDSDDPEEVEELGVRILVDVQAKRREKALTVQLVELLDKAEKEEDYEALKVIFAEIEKYREQDIYTLLEKRITAFKAKMAQKNPADYRDTNVQNVENIMRRNGIKEDDLDEEGQEALNNLKDNANNDSAVVDDLVNTVISSSNQKSAENRLEKLVEEVKNASDETSKKAAQKKLVKFISSRNRSHQEAYQSRKDEIDTLLGIKTASTTNNNKTDNDFPLHSILLIGGLGVVVLLVIGMIFTRQSRGRLSKRNK